MLAERDLLADAEVATPELNVASLGPEIVTGNMEADDEPVFSATLAPISYNTGQAL